MDFRDEDIAHYTDAEKGIAVPRVHKGSTKAMNEYLNLLKIRQDAGILSHLAALHDCKTEATSDLEGLDRLQQEVSFSLSTAVLFNHGVLKVRQLFERAMTGYTSSVDAR